MVSAFESRSLDPLIRTGYRLTIPSSVNARSFPEEVLECH